MGPALVYDSMFSRFYRGEGFEGRMYGKGDKRDEGAEEGGAGIFGLRNLPL